MYPKETRGRPLLDDAFHNGHIRQSCAVPPAWQKKNCQCGASPKIVWFMCFAGGFLDPQSPWSSHYVCNRIYNLGTFMQYIGRSIIFW